MLGTWLALLISALVFGLLHLANPNATLMAGLAIALEAGLMLAAAYLLTGRLWLSMGIHFAWNFTQGGIFGAAVSGQTSSGIFSSVLQGPALLTGGDFGAEASVVAMVVCSVSNTLELLSTSYFVRTYAITACSTWDTCGCSRTSWSWLPATSSTRGRCSTSRCAHGPTSIRYPKAAAETIDGTRTPIELGKAEVIDWGHDGMIIAAGTLVTQCIKAAALLREEGLDIGVINARFVKPLDTEVILRAVLGQSVCGDRRGVDFNGRLRQRRDRSRQRRRSEYGQHPTFGHSRSIHRTCRTQRATGRFGVGCRGHRANLSRHGPTPRSKSADRRRVS